MLQPLAIALLLIGLSPLAALAHDVSLRGTSWVMGDGSGRSITFGTSGRVSGFAGCNRYIGSYAQSGDKLRITVMGNTRMGCFKGKGASDAAFLRVLAMTRAFTITSNGLSLQSWARMAITTLRRK